MAWTTSASLCARPSLADLAKTALKHGRYLTAPMRRSSIPARHLVVVSLSALSLGLAAPLLPTSLLTGILIVAGVALAVVGAGANLARTIVSDRTSVAAQPEQPANPLTETPAAPPVRQAASLPHVVRPQPPRYVPKNHDWAELMARINHELRTPLNAVIGFSEVMSLELYGPLGNERYQDYVRHIRESAADLLKSAEDTLALTALMTNPQPTEPPSAGALEHAVADAWAFVEHKASARNVSLDLALPPDVEVLIEPRALRQVLVNIMSEGIARTSPGGRMSLLAVTDGELIEIVLSVPSAQPTPVPRAGSLAIGLARTLLEMQGTSLLEIETVADGWSAVTVLDRAAQPDFFFNHRQSRATPRYQPAMAS